MATMNHYEHAQHIFSLLVSGWSASGRQLPSAEESKTWAVMSMQYAKAFAEANKTHLSAS